jgi:RNAse (barnase) inhibitor barstar
VVVFLKPLNLKKLVISLVKIKLKLVVSDFTEIDDERSLQNNLKQTFTFKNAEQRNKSCSNIIQMLKFRFSRNFQTQQFILKKVKKRD